MKGSPKPKDRTNAEAKIPRLRRRALRFCVVVLFLFPLVSAGCSARSGDSVQLVLMSPHRDEIRIETESAFRDWFQARCLDRNNAARTNLGNWLTQSTEERTREVHDAIDALLADWRNQDFEPVRAAYAAWNDAPTRAKGQALLSALDAQRDHIPTIELIWQDIGGGTGQIVRYITARFESSPSGIGIDLLFGGGTDIYLRFAQQGVLQKITLPEALFKDRIPPQLNGIPLYDPQGQWYGPMLSSFGILVNREVLRRIDRPEPLFWADLGRADLFSWVSAGDPRMTGSVHMVYEIILQGKGWNEGFGLLLRLGANTHTFIRDSGTLTRTVTMGEVAAAGNLDANALTAVASEPQKMVYHLPAGETLVNPDSIAVLKGAPHQELARAFVEFTLSDAGQCLFFLRPGQPGGPRRYALCRLSVVERLYELHPPETRSVGEANPFRSGGVIHYDSKLAEGRWDALNDLFGAVIADAQPDLVAAWKAVLRVSGPDRQRLEEELFATPCTTEELAAHAKSILDDSPRIRTATVNRWGEQARQRYGRIRRAAENVNP